MTSHTSCRSPESARMMKVYTSAGWHELTTERLWSTRPKPGWRSTPRPGPNDHCHLLRRTPYGTWKTRSQESPAHHWGRTWVQTRGWSQLPPLTHPPIQLNTTPAQVQEYHPAMDWLSSSWRVVWWGMPCYNLRNWHGLHPGLSLSLTHSLFLFALKANEKKKMPVLLPAPLPGPAPLLPHTHLSTILRTAQLPPLVS